MEPVDIILSGFRELFDLSNIRVTPVPASGSDRKYFRITSDNNSFIGAYNPVPEENNAFTGFTRHFTALGLHVPELLGYLPDKHVYFVRDLGDLTLFKWLRQHGGKDASGREVMDVFHRILDNLVLFQTRGIEGLDLDLCFPHRSFDRQSMMWDMNYFKYMFLKLLAVPFNEKQLEHDFNSLADYLLQAGQDYFLYRDFQSANIMLIEGDPWFIDYQGGRKGAPQYDVASLLYDAKIGIGHANREKLLNYYIRRFCEMTHKDELQFRSHYNGFAMIRLLQALGTFGFRGLYEQKPTFTSSIVPGVMLLQEIIRSAEQHIPLPELYNSIRLISDSSLFKTLTLSDSGF